MKGRTKILKNARIIGLSTFLLSIILFSIRSLGLLQALEWAAYDWFFRLRPLEPIDERIVIVGITESDIRRYGHPIKDRDLARLLKKIQIGKPRLIGLDLVRDLPEPPGTEELERAFRTIPYLYGVKSVIGEPSSRINPPLILEKDRRTTTVDVVVDSDGTLRRGMLSIFDGEEIYSLGAYVALSYLQEEGIVQKPVIAQGRQIGNVTLTPFLANDGGYQNADDGGFQFLVNFRNPTQSFKRVSVSQVLSPKVQPNFFNNKIVMIGMTALSIKDEFYTSYSHTLNAPPELMHGVEVQANFASHLLSAVLDGRPIIKTISDGAESAFIFFWGLATAVAVWIVRSIKNYLILFLVISLIVATLIGALFSGSFLAFLQGWWLPFVPSVLLISGTAIVYSILILQQKNQELIRLQEQIIEERKQASLSTLASGIAHEIRNPLIHILNFTNLFFEYLEEIQEGFKKIRTNSSPESEEEIEEILKIAQSNSKETITQIERIKQISDLLSSVARQGKNEPFLTSLSMVGISKPTLTHLNNLVDSILKIASYSRQFEKEDFCINVEANYDSAIGEKSLIVEDFTKVLINLINNACDAVLEKKKREGDDFKPTVSVSTQLLNENLIEVIVQDNGEGISPLIAKKIYEPFATTKPPGQGTGLGLYITYDLVKKNGGQIRWVVEAQRTKFIVLFPVQSLEFQE